MDDTMAEHEQILTLIQNHNMEGLKQLMEHHLTIAQKINLNILENK
ncbi:MAG: hypothetical protein E7253_01745 [Lachnospiraceae bacterium]|nr:hypothetical protein [Lachnospiraceae bacterium]